MMVSRCIITIAITVVELVGIDMFEIHVFNDIAMSYNLALCVSPSVAVKECIIAELQQPNLISMLHQDSIIENQLRLSMIEQDFNEGFQVQNFFDDELLFSGQLFAKP